MRIVTINKDGNPYVFAKVQRIGTSAAGSVDNWAAGGLAAGITDDGYLKEYAFYKYGHGTKVNRHPDTGLSFSEYKVPMLDEAMELAVEAHRHFYNIFTIGWDIAITKDGPIFVEGNENWDLGLAQTCDRPLRKAWMEIIQ